MRFGKFCLVLLVFSPTVRLQSASPVADDPNVRMMRATFRVAGKSKKVEGGDESAAAFVVALGGGSPTSPTRRVVLLTAGHFFNFIKGDTIKIVARRALGDGRYEKVLHPVAIRRKGKELWFRHPDKDIDAAAMVVDLPADLDVAPLEIAQLATTATFASAAFYPGREVFALGFPFAIESSKAGFPVLREGRIASFPPPRPPERRTFLVDLAMSHGMSGAPLYIVGGGGGAPTARARPLVLGMIVAQRELTSDFRGPFETRKVHYPLDLGVAIEATALRELVAKAAAGRSR